MSHNAVLYISIILKLLLSRVEHMRGLCQLSAYFYIGNARKKEKSNKKKCTQGVATLMMITEQL